MGMTYRSGSRTRTPARRSSGSSERKDVYAQITERVIAALESGTVPWHKPWTTETGLPVSMSSRKPYRGVNPFLLGLTSVAAGYTSPWWGTYNMMAEAAGIDRKDSAAVRAWTGLRGQKSTMVVYWKWLFKDDQDDTGKKITKKIPFLRYFHVFNIDQVDVSAWPDNHAPARFQHEKINRTPVERIAAAETIVAGYPKPPRMRTGDAAYYTQHDDTITMPPIDSFDSAEEWYSTLFHEQAHSTGVAKRLNAPGFGPDEFGTFGSAPYSAEELRAEMTAAMLSAVAGLDQTTTLPNSAAYLAFWLRNLREDPKLIVQVAARAQRAADHILNITYSDDSTDEE